MTVASVQSGDVPVDLQELGRVTAFNTSFSLTAAGGLTSYRLAQYTVPPLATYSLLQTVTQPIFEGGALRGHLDQTKARYQEVLAGNYRKTVLTAFSDVETALSGVQTAVDAEQVASVAARTVEQASGLASNGFQGGNGTVLDVLFSQTNVFTAQDALAQARLAHLQSLVALNAALGGGWKR